MTPQIDPRYNRACNGKPLFWTTIWHSELVPNQILHLFKISTKKPSSGTKDKKSEVDFLYENLSNPY